MSEPVISVRGIGKKYRLGFTLSHDTLRDKIAYGMRRMVHSVRRIAHGAKGIAKSRGLHNNPITKSPNNTKDFWALKDISFDVQQGEVVGIIGANGAGKSTLLKILSEITEPTEGEILIKGRIVSLLEVGTGFHPELSGRENVYMNGAILGMTKAEIDAKFDEIMAFSGVEKFIDTPVKRYSSGMSVRLAFAVAAHLEPEILLVDEVLAVGDVKFQKKCLGKMKEVSKGGRTVLFVSHNMTAIHELVDRCILIDKGKIVFDGNPDRCISQYLKSTVPKVSSRRIFPDRIPNKKSPVVIKEVSLKDSDGDETQTFYIGNKWCLEVIIESNEEDVEFQSSLQIRNEYGIYIYHLVSRDFDEKNFRIGEKAKLMIWIPRLALYPGEYSVDIWLGDPSPSSAITFDKIESAISFNLEQGDGISNGRPLGAGKAVVHEVAQWKVEAVKHEPN